METLVTIALISVIVTCVVVVLTIFAGFGLILWLGR